MAGKYFTRIILAIAVLCAVACGELRYSQLDPAASSYHPRRIAVFPTSVGGYEEARKDMDQIVPSVLAGKKWFSEIVDPAGLNRRVQANEELRIALTDYLSKLQTLNYSDASLTKKIGELTQTDAFLMTEVDDWNYMVEKDKNFAKVSIALKLVDAESGKIMWKAGHDLKESYVFLKPDLSNIARNVVRDMVGKMPR